MKINYPDPEGEDQPPTVPPPRVRLTTASTRLAATAAGAALAGSSVRLAFFLARKPTGSSGGIRYAKFRV